MDTIKAMASPRRIAWAALAATLVALGFVLDGATEVGHHLALIGAGVAVGYGFAKDI